ncbi:hypothetical protein RJ639_004189 [Escallonia herrerae]|uniref:Mitochondrial transcription termination factor n=1 Tax=Escallonia herrerae TaxID=1293975 RepID=A0AA88W2D7_9ASTE|nr:hypothetical protein RJ639_004189 [Escallonia herrerae]
MTMYLRKTFAPLSLKNHYHLCKPHISSYFSPLFLSSTSPKRRQPKSAVPVADYLLNTHQFSAEAAAKASLAFKYLKNPENSDCVLSFLKESGFSKTHLEQMVENMPKVLSLKLDRTIKPKIKIFQDLGFPPTDIVQVLSTNPMILSRTSNERLLQLILALQKIFGSNGDVSRLLKIAGPFLGYDLKKTMIPNIEFLKSCGICSSQILKDVFNHLRFYFYYPDLLERSVKRVDELGFSRDSKMLLCAIRTVGSMKVETWELKLQLFRRLGFSEDDILSMFRKMPHVFSVSGKKIEEVTEFLRGTRKLDIAHIVQYPLLLSYSIGKRLKPRIQVMQNLERENLLLKEFNLARVCTIPDIKFLEKYVLPYSDRVSELSCTFNEGTTVMARAAAKSP